MKPFLSPKELAEAIGVSESSIKRWVDGGTILATKTAGGHRRIPGTEAVRFIRETHSPLVRPEALGLSDLVHLSPTAVASEESADLLFDHLRAGHADAARGLLVSLYLGGRTVAQIVDGPVRRAMTRIGEIWRHQESGIFQEHRATDIAMSAIGRLRLLIPPRAPDAPVAVGAAPTGDPYILPTMCAAAVLDSRGFNSVNLGPDTPWSTLLLAQQTLRARLVWLSISAPPPNDWAAALNDDLLPELRARSVPIILGGDHAGSLQLPDAPLLHVGSSMAELEAMIKGLRVAVATSQLP